MATDEFGNHHACEAYDENRHRVLQFPYFAFQTNEFRRKFKFTCHRSREAGYKAWPTVRRNLNEMTAENDLETDVLTKDEFLELVYEIEDEGGSVDWLARVITNPPIPSKKYE